MSIHNIGFYEDLTKLSLNYHQISSNMHLTLSSLSTLNTELDIFLLIFHIPIAVNSLRTITTGLYFCSVQKESIVEENLKTIKC